MSQQPQVRKAGTHGSIPSKLSTLSPSDASHVVLQMDSNSVPALETNSSCKQRTLNKQEILRIKSENSARKLPRIASIGGSTFYISYGSLIFSGRYSIHQVLRAQDKRLFSLKIDDREPSMILHDEKVRSKLVGVDLPKIIYSERRSSVTFNVMEPLSLTFKSFIQSFSMKKENRLSNSAILLRNGRMCIRLLKKLHDNGILHANINPHTFVLPCIPNRPDGKPDLKRGPIIVDFSHSIDCREDLLYDEENPEARFNSAMYPGDGGIYTKRDDMENLGYLLLFLANGHIPWEVRKRRDQLLFGKNCLSELDRNVKGIPQVIKNYLTYIRTVKWNETPDYELLDLCLSNKIVDIRAEIKARRERYRLNRSRKRRRAPPARSNSQQADANANLLKVQRIQTGSTPKRHEVDQNWTCHSYATPTEPEQEYVQMSLQLLPNIALKFSDPAEDDEEELLRSQCAGGYYNRMAEQYPALSTSARKEKDEGMSFGMPDPLPANLARDNSQKSFNEEYLSNLANDSKVAVVEDEVDTSMAHADTYQQATVLTHNSTKIYSRHQDEQSHSLRQATADNIQFHFPFLPWENDDEQRHPWEDEIGSVYFSRP